MALYRLVTPYFVCGVVTVRDIVVTAAPIVSWTRGKPMHTVTSWIVTKLGTVELIVQ